MGTIGLAALLISLGLIGIVVLLGGWLSISKRPPDQN
jgi:hypothetical protein